MAILYLHMISFLWAFIHIYWAALGICENKVLIKYFNCQIFLNVRFTEIDGNTLCLEMSSDELPLVFACALLLLNSLTLFPIFPYHSF